MCPGPVVPSGRRAWPADWSCTHDGCPPCALQARAFVLEVSLQAGAAAAQLPTMECGACGGQRFDAALACPACGVQWEACVASGYPVDDPAARVVSTSGLPARRDAWNEWVEAFGTDPVTGVPAVPSY